MTSLLRWDEETFLKRVENKGRFLFESGYGGSGDSYQLVNDNIRSHGCPMVAKQDGISSLHHDGLIVFRVLVRARVSL